MVMGKKIGLICLLLVFLSLFVLAADNNTVATDNTTKIIEGKNNNELKIAVNKEIVKDTCVYYFYGTGCELCSETNSFIISLETKYPELKIKKFEVYYNKTHRQLLQNYLDAYGVAVNQQGLPIVFLPTSYFLGPKSITTFLEGSINANTDSSCPQETKTEVIGIIGKQKAPKNLIETLTCKINALY